MQIQAYRRKEPTTVNLCGITVEFKPNAQGDCVADVDQDDAVERLLSITEGYVEYQSSEAAEDVDQADSMDVSKWTAKQVRAYADSHGISLPSAAPVAELRTLLAQAIAER